MDSANEIWEVSDTLKELKDKPIFFTLDVSNEMPRDFYRKLIETGRIELVRLVFRKVN